MADLFKAETTYYYFNEYQMSEKNNVVLKHALKAQCVFNVVLSNQHQKIQFTMI